MRRRASADLRQAGVKVLAEVRTPDAGGAPLDVVDGLLLKGNEAGGFVGEDSSFILLQKWLGRTGLPLYLRGGLTPHVAAACSAVGVAGGVLESQLLLMDEVRAARRRCELCIGNLSGSETVAVGDGEHGEYFRILVRPGHAAARSLVARGEGLGFAGARAAGAGPRRWAGAIRPRACCRSARTPASPRRGGSSTSTSRAVLQGDRQRDRSASAHRRRHPADRRGCAAGALAEAALADRAGADDAGLRQRRVRRRGRRRRRLADGRLRAAQGRAARRACSPRPRSCSATAPGASACSASRRRRCSTSSSPAPSRSDRATRSSPAAVPTRPCASRRRACRPSCTCPRRTCSRCSCRTARAASSSKAANAAATSARSAASCCGARWSIG